jgi:hypothetical protein
VVTPQPPEISWQEITILRNSISPEAREPQPDDGGDLQLPIPYDPSSQRRFFRFRIQR